MPRQMVKSPEVRAREERLGLILDGALTTPTRLTFSDIDSAIRERAALYDLRSREGMPPEWRRVSIARRGATLELTFVPEPEPPLIQPLRQETSSVS